MGLKRTDEFRKDAVRMALTSGLTRRQLADDLGVGISTLNKWVTAHRDTDVVSSEERELARENKRLRRENRSRIAAAPCAGVRQNKARHNNRLPAECGNPFISRS